jgi:hypothetical protein
VKFVGVEDDVAALEEFRDPMHRLDDALFERLHRRGALTTTAAARPPYRRIDPLVQVGGRTIHGVDTSSTWLTAKRLRVAKCWNIGRSRGLAAQRNGQRRGAAASAPRNLLQSCGEQEGRPRSARNY